jgi:putative transposase
MAMPPPHRKQVRHFNELGHVHELTFSCYHRLPLLTNDHWKKLFSQSIDAGIQKQGFQLVAFVYMPEHVHLLVFPAAPTAQIERLLYAIKRPFSFRVKQDLLAKHDPLLERLTVRERPGKMAFRFWQEGPGYDRNLTTPEAVRDSMEYIHWNPVKRGLCTTPGEWKWSSWRHYNLPHELPDADLPLIHGLPTIAWL